MPTPFSLIIPSTLANQTLARIFRTSLPQLTWPQITQLIDDRRISVNKVLCLDDTRKLSEGDLLQVQDTPLPPPPTDADVRLVYLDDHLVVVDKPAGMMSLRRSEERDWPLEKRAKQPSLDEVVARLVEARRPTRPPGPQPSQSRRRLVRIQSPSPTAPSPKLPRRVFDVHRLDRDTSGLVLFALSYPIQSALIRLIKKHKIEREYLAVVHGHPHAMKIDTWLVRDRGDGLRGSLLPGQKSINAQRAITWIDPIEAIGPCSLVRCRLATGRTHQIRIHLAEIGHRVCGEPLYTHAPGHPPQLDTTSAPRQALHAIALRFLHPVTVHPIELKANLPPDLQTWLTHLRTT